MLQGIRMASEMIVLQGHSMASGSKCAGLYYGERVRVEQGNPMASGVILCRGTDGGAETECVG